MRPVSGEPKALTNTQGKNNCTLLDIKTLTEDKETNTTENGWKLFHYKHDYTYV